MDPTSTPTQVLLAIHRCCFAWHTEKPRGNPPRQHSAIPSNASLCDGGRLALHSRSGSGATCEQTGHRQGWRVTLQATHYQDLHVRDRIHGGTVVSTKEAASMAARMSEKAFGNERIYLDVLHVQACSSAEGRSVVGSLLIHGVVFRFCFVVDRFVPSHSLDRLDIASWPRSRPASCLDAPGGSDCLSFSAFSLSSTHKV